MSLNKAVVIIIVALLAASTIKYVFGGAPGSSEDSGDFFDNENTKILREKEDFPNPFREKIQKKLSNCIISLNLIL